MSSLRRHPNQEYLAPTPQADTNSDSRCARACFGSPSSVNQDLATWSLDLLTAAEGSQGIQAAADGG